MNGTYNSNLYLIKNDLNNIENQIESLTNEIQDEVFNSTLSPLRNIQVGDNLSGKTIYLDFPRDIYESIPISDSVNVISTDRSSFIRYVGVTVSNYNIYRIFLSYLNSNTNTRSNIFLYTSYSSETNIRSNCARFKLPNDFGTVTEINTNNDIYQYIKIYDNEQIIPNYEKHTWADNEVLSMQKIDNIEHGIENIGYYYYKPNGWINGEEWLKTSNVENQDTNTNIKNISYRDLNRWVTDLSMINFNDLENMTIWNTDFTQINWNEDTDVEWEEY